MKNVAVMDLMEGFLSEVRTKKASVKQANDPSEPTTQPVMKKDDGTQKATTGAHAAEMTSYVKKELGGMGITGQEDAEAGKGKDPADTIGTIKQQSDEVKGNVQEPKAHKDLPPSSHVSNQKGEKYSAEMSAVLTSGSKLIEAISGLGIKSASVKKAEAEKQAADKKKEEDAAKAANAGTPPAEGAGSVKEQVTVPKTASEQEKQAAMSKYAEDAQAGYYAAALLAKSLGIGKEAEAEQKLVSEKIAHIVSKAHTAGDTFVDYMQGHAEAEKKAALAKAGMGGETPAISPEELSPAPTDGPPDGGGGMPMGGAGGMDGGMSGAPGGAPGGAGGNPEETIQALAQALAAAGVTPEELAQLIAAEQGGGGMGGPGAGAPPPPEAGAGAPPPAPDAAKAGKEETSTDSKEAQVKKAAAAKLALIKTAALKIQHVATLRKLTSGR